MFNYIFFNQNVRKNEAVFIIIYFFKPYTLIVAIYKVLNLKKILFMPFYSF